MLVCWEKWGFWAYFVHYYDIGLVFFLIEIRIHVLPRRVIRNIFRCQCLFNGNFNLRALSFPLRILLWNRSELFEHVMPISFKMKSCYRFCYDFLPVFIDHTFKLQIRSSFRTHWHLFSCNYHVCVLR